MYQSRAQEMDQYLPNKDAMYGFLLRKGYFLPSRKTDIVTIAFLDKVFRGEIYCPMQTEVPQVQLASTPTKPELELLVERALRKRRDMDDGKLALVEEIKAKNANSSFLLGLVRLWNPACSIFAESYVAIQRPELPQRRADGALDPYQGAFENIPVPKRKGGSKKKQGVAANIARQRQQEPMPRRPGRTQLLESEMLLMQMENQRLVEQ